MIARAKLSIMTERFAAIIRIPETADVVGASIRKPPICPRGRGRLPFATNDKATLPCHGRKGRNLAELEAW